MAVGGQEYKKGMALASFYFIFRIIRTAKRNCIQKHGFPCIEYAVCLFAQSRKICLALYRAACFAFSFSGRMYILN